jgi:serine/threonine protein kinase
MSTSFHVRARRVLERALQESPDSREDYIRRSCAGDPRLLEEVISLLPHYEELQDFEPQRPQGAAWRCPGTTTFTRARERASHAAPSDPGLTPPFTIGDYTVTEVLGRGGMGVVYGAIDPVTRRQVAIKLLHCGLATHEDRQWFIWETEVLRQLHHPGIAQIIHTGIADLTQASSPEAGREHRPYLVMGYVRGEPLTKYAEVNRLRLRQRLGLFARVCDAVGYAHRRGIVHRDLKPDNILVDSSGQPKILDFGISRIVALQSGLPHDGRGQFTGTLAYASPEQLVGDNDHLTPRSDVYALGVIGHELLTGELPQPCGTHVQLALEKICVDDDVVRRGLKDEVLMGLASILAAALRQKTGAHYDCADELGADVQRLLARFLSRSAWARLKRSLLGVLKPRVESAPESMTRPLSAVLRQRIAMAIESEEHRSRVADTPPAERSSD